MMKLSELKKTVEARIKKRNELEQKIADLQVREQTAKENAQTAAEAGSVVAYKTATTEAQNIGVELLVARAQFKKMCADSSVSREDADVTWKEYEADYNRRFDKLYSDFQKKRAELLTAYRELFELQRQAFIDREWLAENCGIDTHLYSAMSNPYEEAFPCKALPWKNEDGAIMRISGTITSDPDALYYFACYAKEHNISAYGVASGEGEIGMMKDVLNRRTTRPY